MIRAVSTSCACANVLEFDWLVLLPHRRRHTPSVSACIKERYISSFLTIQTCLFISLRSNLFCEMAASDVSRSGRTAAENIKFHIAAERSELSSTLPAFIINKPQSVHADVIGLSEGELISSNAALAVTLAPKRDALQQKVDHVNLAIGLTNFKNWGETMQNLLLYAKPTEVTQVKALVAAANELDIKVGENN